MPSEDEDKRCLDQDECLLGGNRKVPTSFKSYLGNSNNEYVKYLVKYVFQKLRETLAKVLTSFQTIYSTNLDDGADRVTSQSNEIIDFYCHHKEDDTKMFSYINLLCNDIRLSRVSLYESVTNLTFLNAIWFKTGTRDDQRYIYLHIY